jgi:hypothetical protein
MKQTHTHPILRRHALITKGVREDKADAIVQAAAETLTTLAAFPAAPLRDDLRPAPGTYPAAPARAKLDLGQVRKTLNQEAA